MEYLIGNEINLEIDLDHGARLTSVEWKGIEFSLPHTTITKGGWYAMAPWAGRVRDGKLKKADGSFVDLPTHITPPHAIHGYGLDSSWQLLRTDGRSKISTRLDLPAPYKGAFIEQKYELLDNAIRWSLEYFAEGCDLPSWMGFHPWFARQLKKDGAEIGEAAILEFTAEDMFVSDGEKIPTGQIIKPTPAPWDNCFTNIRGIPAITWPGVARVEIESDAPYWVVYTENPDGICVEPETAPPDAANLGIKGEESIEALFIFTEDYEI